MAVKAWSWRTVAGRLFASREEAIRNERCEELIQWWKDKGKPGTVPSTEPLGDRLRDLMSEHAIKSVLAEMSDDWESIKARLAAIEERSDGG